MKDLEERLVEFIVKLRLEAERLSHQPRDESHTEHPLRVALAKCHGQIALDLERILKPST